jgi:hypothetical protein
MRKWTGLLLAGTALVLAGCKENSSDAAASPPRNVDSPIKAKLAQYTTVRLSSDLRNLTANERQVIPLLIDAARLMDEIYWRQAYGNRDSLLQSLRDADVRR